VISIPSGAIKSIAGLDTVASTDIFQFLLVRLRGFCFRLPDLPFFLISIPSGAIKRYWNSYAIGQHDQISIPSGAIKSFLRR